MTAARHSPRVFSERLGSSVLTSSNDGARRCAQKKMHINDWSAIQTLFDKLNKQVEKAQKVTETLGAPRVYIKMLVELEVRPAPRRPALPLAHDPAHLQELKQCKCALMCLL